MQIIFKLYAQQKCENIHIFATKEVAKELRGSVTKKPFCKDRRGTNFVVFRDVGPERVTSRVKRIKT